MNNEKAQAAFLAEIDKAYKLATAITEALDNHLGVSPETVNWGHVGTTQHLLSLLNEAATAAGIRSEN